MNRLDTQFGGAGWFPNSRNRGYRGFVIAGVLREFERRFHDRHGRHCPDLRRIRTCGTDRAARWRIRELQQRTGKQGLSEMTVHYKEDERVDS
jgi:hypothetical protein